MGYVPMWEAVRPDDHFSLMLRRQGWHLVEFAPMYMDPKVIRWRTPFTTTVQESGYASFYAAFSANTFRKVLRAIFVRPRTHLELSQICGDEAQLRGMLAYMEAGGIVTAQGDAWTKGPQCEGIDNTGPTLEWCIAEWFRHELQVPARHSVKLEEVRGGGDLDVVAFVNDIRVMVECKTGHPDHLSETEIRWFLQRAHDFSPEIAVLLIDTESTITEPAQLMNEIFSEMNWLEGHPEATALPDDVRQQAGQPEEAPGYKGLYGLARNVFLTGVPDSIEASLSAVLRFYHSYVRHQLILAIPLEWDFVERKAHRQQGQRYGVEGQVWVR